MNTIKKTKLSHIIKVPHIADEASLCVVEETKSVPFPIKRVYYIFNSPENTPRGKHAHKKTQQLLFCIRGKVTLLLDNGLEKEAIVIDKPNEGVFLDAMMWHEMHSFSKDAILLVFASDLYSESDYIRDYKTFIQLAQKNLWLS